MLNAVQPDVVTGGEVRKKISLSEVEFTAKTKPAFDTRLCSGSKSGLFCAHVRL